ncbi:hypothetical protein WMY93_011946 [Mugilogobius chulae]|uniref:Uncharacterized protein n=1 Tax=Mugilogobius chulae TaxID=88201 RepID=A0AAW0P5D0_9GOBI
MCKSQVRLSHDDTQSQEEVDKLREKMEEKRAKAKTKKSKKSKSAAETVAAPPESKDEASSTKAGGSQENGSSDPDVAGPSSSKSSSSGASKRSIQEMQDKSEAFKSIFTSHSSAKRTKDQMSNWVTHTPYHF